MELQIYLKIAAQCSIFSMTYSYTGTKGVNTFYAGYDIFAVGNRPETTSFQLS